MRWAVLKSDLYRLWGEQSSGIMSWTVLKTAYPGVLGCSLQDYCVGMYRRMFYKGFVGEKSSVIMRWIVMKTDLYRLVGGAIFRYTAVDCTEEYFIQVGGDSALQVYCNGLY